MNYDEWNIFVNNIKIGNLKIIKERIRNMDKKLINDRDIEIWNETKEVKFRLLIQKFK